MLLSKLQLQTHHVYLTLKRRRNDRFYVVSMWNTRGVFGEYLYTKVYEEPSQTSLSLFKK